MILRLPYILGMALLLCFSFVSFTFAQSLGVLPDQVTLEMDPRIPQPLEPVELTLTSFVTDLNRARISLYVDGQLQSQAIGQTVFTVSSPQIGAVSEIRAVIETIDSGIIEKNITIRPGQVDLLFEAIDSYAPDFYQGKKLPAHEGGVKIVAIPYFLDESGRKLDPKSLIYSWKIGRNNQVAQSGYGRDTFLFEGSPLYRTKEITVQVESVDDSIIATRRFEIPAYDPVIRFYQQHPLWGLDLSQAFIADRPLRLDIPELTVEAVPYFFSGINDSTKTDYDWRMNGEPLATFGDRNVINLITPDENVGNAVINLRINNNEHILQIAESLFRVFFGDESQQSSSENTSGDSFFGL